MSVGFSITRISIDEESFWNFTCECVEIEALLEEYNPKSLNWDIISARPDLTEEIVRRFPDLPWNSDLMKFEDV